VGSVQATQACQTCSSFPVLALHRRKSNYAIDITHYPETCSKYLWPARTELIIDERYGHDWFEYCVNPQCITFDRANLPGIAGTTGAGKSADPRPIAATAIGYGGQRARHTSRRSVRPSALSGGRMSRRKRHGPDPECHCGRLQIGDDSVRRNQRTETINHYKPTTRTCHFGQAARAATP
jgi:hypothetical protein